MKPEIESISIKDKKKKEAIKMKINSLLLLFFCLIQVSLNAQSTIPVLSWRTHFSYNNVTEISLGQNVLYASTPLTLFSLDLEELSLAPLNKNNGLSDVGIGTIKVMDDSETLLIGYTNGNIDVVSAQEVRNIRSVRDFVTTQSKEFRQIEAYNNLLFFSGDLGVIVFDSKSFEVVEAYQNLGQNGTALAISDLLIENDSIFLATDDGILSASMSPSVNRQDFNNWKRELSGLAFQELESTNKGLFAASESDLFSNKSGAWSFTENFTNPIVRLEDNGSVLRITTESSLLELNSGNSSVLYNAEDTETINSHLSQGNLVWLATSQGLKRINLTDQSTETFLIPGPTTDDNVRVEAQNGQLFFLPSSFDRRSPQNTLDQFSIEDRSWSNFQLTTDGNAVGQFTDIETSSDRVWFSSYDQGLFQLSENENLSALLSSNDGPSLGSDGFQLSSIALEETGLLWASFYDRTQSLYSYEPGNGNWTDHSPDHPLAKFIRDIFIGPNGDKWLTVDPNEGGGILVYNEGSGRERYLNLNGGQGGLPSNEVTDIELDQDLFVWVATSRGIAFFPNPFNILNGGSLTASVPIYENRLLLRNEFITDIVVDPANRKWFGTRNNGVWLFTETGEELVFHCTAQNSPLPSNNIISMDFIPETGELFLTTDKGAISFRSDATQGTAVHENVKVYPNPVIPDFTGQIVIEGLVNNAQLKITDVSGNLVRELRANGSTAIWNGRDLNNSRVKTGVYLVFSSSEDGMETYITKIVVI